MMRETRYLDESEIYQASTRPRDSVNLWLFCVYMRMRNERGKGKNGEN